MEAGVPIDSLFVASGTERLHCATGGQKGEAPVLILLHGFPDHWAVWRRQIEVFAPTRQVVAPDGRGVNLSSKPAAVEAYALSRLLQDIARIANHVSPEWPVDLCGHDWGGVTAWAFAALHPERVRRLAVLNAPHPRILGEALADPEQQAASAYMAALRAPGAEERLSAGGFEVLRRIHAPLRETGALSEAEAEAQRHAWSEPGALAGALNWYRANDFSDPAVAEAVPPLSAETPVLLIWGEEDRALLPSMAARHRTVAADLTVEMIPGAGHWPALERPEVVNRLLARHFAIDG
jgi:pimeloyl-ACP methyl ester carboxylesterase